jgi:deoxyribodipyrimidine photo-lyase
MPPPTRKILHIFRRDHRLSDNTALLAACSQKDVEIIPIFIFTHAQIRDNPLKSTNCIQFMCESLTDLDGQLREKGSKLLIFYGDEFDILKRLLNANPDIYGVSFNMDYTQYSMERDQHIIDLVRKIRPVVPISGVGSGGGSGPANINLRERSGKTSIELFAGLPENIIIREDIMMNPVNTVLTTGGKMYMKFTPYSRASLARDIPEPTSNRYGNFLSARGISAVVGSPGGFLGKCVVEIGEFAARFYGNSPNPHLIERGGRTRALEILRNLGDWRGYNENRDMLTYKTTHLSPFNKFGCVSCREVFHAMKSKLGRGNGVISQMVWRDFFYNLSYNHPEIYKGAMNPKYVDIKWENDAGRFRAWCEGRTGFPIVDACMRELNTTGYMHNRGRLIVANFLSRILQVDWRRGEHYFAKMLYDYDPAQNNFGWQICATVSGTESRPLNQTIMNPWIQSAKFDPDAEYIKKWMPELKDIPASKLHKWDIYGEAILKSDDSHIKYILPIVNYKNEKEDNLKMYKSSH